MSMLSVDAFDGASPVQNMYRIMFQDHPQPMWVYDADTLAFLAVNEAAVRRYGYSRAEFLRLNIRNIRPEEDIDAFHTLFKTPFPATVNHGVWRHRTKSGSIIDTEVMSAATTFSGRAARMVLAQDVTIQLRAERLQARALATIEAIVEASPLAIVGMDAAHHVTIWNPAAELLFGWRRDEVLDRPLPYLPTGHEQQFQHIDQELATGNKVVGVETKRVRKDGATVDVLLSITALPAEDGGAPGAVALFVDISARKLAEEWTLTALSAADTERRRLEAVLEALPVGVCIANLDGVLTQANSESCRIWGSSISHPTSFAELTKNKAWQADSGEALAPGDWAVARLLRGDRVDQSEVLEIERADGTHGFVLNSVAPIIGVDGSMAGVVNVNVDVTAQREATRERERLLSNLEWERQRLATLFQQAPAFIAVLRGPDHIFELANDAYMELVGDRRAIIGKPAAEALPEIVEQGFARVLDEVYATGKAFTANRMRVWLHRIPGGVPEERFLNFVYRAMEEVDGTRSGILVHGVDVTEHVRAGESLAQSEERYRTLVELSPDGIVIHADGIIVFANAAAARMARAQRSGDLVGRPAMDFVTPESRSVVAERWAAMAAGGDAPAMEQQWRRLDGRTTYVEVTSTPLHFDNQPAIQTIFRDVTERRNLEEQLRQSQKMEAVGRLAGGVAHDFNNMLTVIKANAEFLLGESVPGDERYRDALEIRKAAERAAALTRQLLAFSRKQILKPQLLDMNEIVSGILPMVSRLVGEDVLIEHHLAAGELLAMADPGQIEQVILNLIVNARDAMKHGGCLTIETAAVDRLPPNCDTGPDERRGPYVLLAIRDTGIGMNTDVQARAFEPFFTTKAVGEGTGLGLSTVYGIVKQSAGHVTVTSAPGAGTTISVYLPRADERGVERAKPRAPVVLQPAATGTVLLVEDEDSVRAVVQRALSSCGYTVLAANGGHEALSILEQHGDDIELVLTDMIMPYMTGRALVDTVHATHPNMPALYMSGYTDAEIVQRGVLDPGVSFLQKPFTPDAVCEAVRAALAAAGRTSDHG